MPSYPPWPPTGFDPGEYYHSPFEPSNFDLPPTPYELENKYTPAPADYSTPDVGWGRRVLGGVGSVLGAPAAGVDWLYRKSAELQGMPVKDDATVGSLVRNIVGLNQGDEGYAGRIAGKGLEFGVDVARDPVTWAMGGLGGAVARGATATAAIEGAARLAPEAIGFLTPEAAAAASGIARTASYAAPVQKAASAAFAGLMGTGAVEEGAHAYDTLKREGFTPQAAEELFGTGLAAAGAYAGAKHLFSQHPAVKPVADRLEELDRQGVTKEPGVEAPAAEPPPPQASPSEPIVAPTVPQVESAAQAAPIPPSAPPVAPVDPVASRLADLAARAEAEKAVAGPAPGVGVPIATPGPVPVVPHTATPIRQPWEMSYDELSKAHEDAKAYEKNVDVEVLGAEGAKEYNRLRRTANGTGPGADAAQTRVEAIEAALPESQRNRLFGIGETGPSAEELSAYRTAVGNLDWESPQRLGASLRWAITKIGDATDPLKMNEQQRIAFAQMRAAHDGAVEAGWDPGEVSRAAAKAAAARFSDPADAAFMLQRFAKEKPVSSRPALPATEQSRAPERRTAEVPVAEDRRTAERRALAQELQLSPDHPAVDRLIASGTDALTGVRNQNAYHEAIGRQMLGHTAKPAAVSEFDVAGAGAGNAAFGERYTDARLAATGEALRSIVGEHGQIFRRGGDEFVIHWNDAANGAELHPEVSKALDNAHVIVTDANGNPEAAWTGVEHYGGHGPTFDDASATVYAAKPKPGTPEYKALPRGLAEKVAAGRASGSRLASGDAGLRAGGEPSPVQEAPAEVAPEPAFAGSVKYSTKPAEPSGRAARDAEIAKLREENKDALAVPLVSEGGISAVQIGRMGQRERAQWDERRMRRMDVESKIRDLSRSDEEIAAADRKVQERDVSNRLLQIDRRLQDFEQVGKGKNGKLKPTYQREADKLLAEKAALTSEREGQGGIKFATEPNKLGFYSQLQRAAEKIPQPMKGSDLYRYLTDSKRGVKAEEMKWSGLDDFLRERAGQKVTKEQIAEFLRENDVQVKEVSSGKPEVSGAEAQALRDWAKTQDDAGAAGALDPEIAPGSWAGVVDAALGGDREAQGHLEYADIPQELVAPLQRDGPFRAKFAQYQLPGGENYREVLLTLPGKPRTPEAAAQAYYESFVRRGGESAWSALSEAKKREVMDSTPSEATASPTFSGGHFEEPNVLAHIRLNDRTDASGARVLFVEELQSDFGQRFRRSQGQIAKSVADNWTSIVKKMKDNGVLKVECD